MKHFFEQYGETIFFFLLALVVVGFYRLVGEISLQ